MCPNGWKLCARRPNKWINNPKFYYLNCERRARDRWQEGRAPPLLIRNDYFFNQLRWNCFNLSLFPLPFRMYRIVLVEQTKWLLINCLEAAAKSIRSRRAHSLYFFPLLYSCLTVYVALSMEAFDVVYLKRRYRPNILNLLCVCKLNPFTK